MQPNQTGEGMWAATNVPCRNLDGLPSQSNFQMHGRTREALLAPESGKKKSPPIAAMVILPRKGLRAFSLSAMEQKELCDCTGETGAWGLHHMAGWQAVVQNDAFKRESGLLKMFISNKTT